MAKKDKFIWLADSGEARRTGKLTRGQEHDTAAFGEEIVAEWVRSGAAAYVKSKHEKEN
jgi:hypothetical protein